MCLDKDGEGLKMTHPKAGLTFLFGLCHGWISPGVGVTTESPLLYTIILYLNVYSVDRHGFRGTVGVGRVE